MTYSTLMINLDLGRSNVTALQELTVSSSARPEQVLIGWKDMHMRESQRAIADALPLLKQAVRVIPAKDLGADLVIAGA